ncbi:MAG TPA: ABC transporter permease [Verrucomicrobiota bacterium]|nr:ABC transporter permease [Verrucomicrobiota bacterium]
MKRNLAIPTILAVLIFGVLPEILQPVGMRLDPYKVEVADRLHAPYGERWFGTDSLGRDLLARSITATAISLRVVGRAMAVAYALSLVLGAVAGWWHGRWPDKAISYVIALLHTVPFILLVIACTTVFGGGLNSIYFIIGCIMWAAPARLVRAEAMQLRNAPFVRAQRAMGFGPAAIFRRCIMPLTFGPPLVALLYLTPEIIGLDVGLSYFGLGAQPPTPTVGRLIFEGATNYSGGWWLATLPAAVLLLIVVLIHQIIPRQELSAAR